ncbi:MAG: hypothetical protein JWL76_2015 [Thermoleophilia bacterium]|nr:hypothetical protein [Thermoleophilia bacterium]
MNRRNETIETPAGHDTLLSAKQIAPMLGYEPASYKAVYAYLERQGIEPHYLSERRKRYWRSDIVALLRQGGASRAPRTAQPESEPTRFRKRAS